MLVCLLRENPSGGESIVWDLRWLSPHSLLYGSSSPVRLGAPGLGRIQNPSPQDPTQF